MILRGRRQGNRVFCRSGVAAGKTPTEVE